MDGVVDGESGAFQGSIAIGGREDSRGEVKANMVMIFGLVYVDTKPQGCATSSEVRPHPTRDAVMQGSPFVAPSAPFTSL